MFARIVKESLVRNRRRKLVAVVSVALGAAVATGVLTVALGVGDKMNRELRSYGANIEALPQERSVAVQAAGISYQASAPVTFLSEDDLPKLKSIFWGNNILHFAPFLDVPVQAASSLTNPAWTGVSLSGTWFQHQLNTEAGAMVTGVRGTSPWWKVTGGWPQAGECLAGARFAESLKISPGDVVNVRIRPGAEPARLKVSGILSTGGDEDRQLVANLADVQRVSGLSGRMTRVEISALTKPDDALVKRDPSTLTPDELERLSCSPYPALVARDVERALGGSEARPVRRISETEGSLLSRINLMLVLVALAALGASVIGVASTTMTTVLERTSEIGLMKAIGASDLSVVSVFAAESAITGLAGGVLGLGIGFGFAQIISRTVFGSGIEVSLVLFPLVLGLAVCVALAGSAVPLKTALAIKPTKALGSRQ